MWLATSIPAPCTDLADISEVALNPALIKLPLFLLCLLPLAHLAQVAITDAHDVESIEAMTRGLGGWALNFLLLTLMLTPLRKYTGWTWLAPLRRMLGLYAFFYAFAHMASYLGLDQRFDWQAIIEDVSKRPFMIAGMLGFALLLPLAVTSNAIALRRLGGKRWQKLHRLIYLASPLAVLHYSWMVKADIAKPSAYAALLVLLLGWRLWWRLREGRGIVAGSASRKPVRRVIPLIVKK
ncbi:MAG: sulfoxide reductase heme-binding subunit YedZ [Rhodocyclales bacterium]|nr:sulfoxide reductase heme-binding subunit YedZ [Rhodocyclales bacterium]